ncbi:hypothetical protein NP603_13765 [Methylomonas sp. SURF-1]|uniref:Uncharacterized protein n=1 Tax=Methylomonas aurea TaxID=2952224 RepID=A0ABT1UIX0_9GAMM|nr:hypothetical protein [Methylomonas sp. SURF-1]MCQ8182184.1 hypothetical protein [Methylomonas sp. SURF-1]
MSKELKRASLSLAVDVLFFSTFAGIGFTGGALIMLCLLGLIHG